MEDASYSYFSFSVSVLTSNTRYEANMKQNKQTVPLKNIS